MKSFLVFAGKLLFLRLLFKGNNMRFGLLLVLACAPASLFVGCGEAKNNAFVEKVEMDFAAVVKSDLQAIEKSGRLGSGMQVLLSNVQALKEKDPGKADAIKKGLDEMMDLHGEDKIKAKAKELIKLL